MLQPSFLGTPVLGRSSPLPQCCQRLLGWQKGEKMHWGEGKGAGREGG